MISEIYDNNYFKRMNEVRYRKLTILRNLSGLLLACISVVIVKAQSRIDTFYSGDIKITIDQPQRLLSSRKTIICFYALPNGNTTAQTMGKKMLPGDDWHYDIQHIRAQTAFIRAALKRKNFIVVYLENDFKSWPAWKQKHADFKQRIPQLIDSLVTAITKKKKDIYLNGHSGGGSFIFGYLAGVQQIPAHIKRISFLDSDYGYDSSYFPVLKEWLTRVNDAALNVFAYNDSIALYNNKPVVSATGGTWYRSHLLLKHLQTDYSFAVQQTDSIQLFKSKDKRIQFFFKENYNRGIYHTQQVELNGFIHSILCGTRRDSKGYQYYGGRAYGDYIE